jgi:predicted amidohydrolase YtcJ
MMKRALALAFALAIPVFCAAAPSIVLINGKVFTGPGNFAQAVAIEGNKISAVGTTVQIRALADADTRIIDLEGKLVIPGINDAHTHPLWSAPGFQVSADINATIDQIAPLIAFAVDETPADLPIHVTVGGPVINDPTVTRAKLDALAPGRKIFLHAFTGHGLVLSTAAMTELGVALNAPDPLGGTFGRDASGALNGRAFEYAQYPLERKLANGFTDEELAQAFAAFASEAISFGITSVQAMAGPDEERFVRAVDAAQSPLRVRVIAIPAVAARGRLSNGGALKWILDGTPIEKGAALRTPYASGGTGRQNFVQADVRDLLKIATDTNRQILLHAVGDATLASTLEVLKAKPMVRPRIEHGDGALEDLVSLIKTTGVIIVQNPTHFPFSSAYPNKAYMPFRSLVDAGIPVAIGSDGPINPYLNIFLATERADRPNESLTREQALLAYTSGSAFAEFKETEKGKIAVGMLADLAVLSKDLFAVRPPVVPNITAAMTIIDGQVVFEAQP